MAGTRQIPQEVVDREFDSAQIGSQIYIRRKEDPSTVHLVNRFDEEKGVYEVTEGQEGEYTAVFGRASF